MPGLIEFSGAQPKKPISYAPLFIEDLWPGLFTNRPALHDPSGIYERKYMGGRPGSLIGGLNTEISVNNTVIRRYGLSKFSLATYPTPPLVGFSFEIITGAIQVIIDTGSSPSFVVSSVATSIGTPPNGTAVYTGVFTGGAGDAFVGMKFLVGGFLGANNNGTFTCTASTATTLTLTNSVATTESATASAFTSGAVYFDQQAGSGGSLVLTSVTNSASGAALAQSPSAVYTGVITGGANNAFSGLRFVVTGFTNSTNNGTFICLFSTSTTLTLLNAQAIAETTTAAAISSGKVILFGKAPGAGQTHFIAVAGVLYMGDGVDTKKYTPLNPNGFIWNWGIATPTVAPILTVTQSSASAVSWTPLTEFSTFGLIVDGNGNAESLISVNNSGTNNTQYGTSGNGEPAWNQTPGGTTSDGGVTWTNWGPIPAWTAHTVYNNGSIGGTLTNPSQIYDPTTQSLQINIAAGSAQGTSGSVKPNFIAVQGASLHDPPGGNTPPNVKWFTIFPAPTRWKSSHAYTTFLGTDTANTAIVEPSALPAGVGQTVFLQICTTAGTSGASGTQPPFPVLGTSGTQTADGDLIWLSLGSVTRANSTQYFAWSGQGSTFSVIVVGGRFYVCTQTGVSASSAPSFAGTVYGTVVGDGTVSWADVGPTTTWAASTKWYLPLSGFAPPSTSQPYGGASVVDSNGNLETVIVSGLSGTPTHPAWAAAGLTTTDGTVTWFNEGVANSNALIWFKSHTWAYSYKARALDDFYSVPINGVLPVPPVFIVPPYPSGFTALPAPSGSETNAISTASPVTTLTGGNTGAIVTLKIPYSNDPQVDTIVIWRDADGGGGGQMFELTEIPNIPQPVGTIKYAFFQDFLPDIPTTIGGIAFPGLDELSSAPINNSNDPPDLAFLPMAYNFERIWGDLGQSVPFSGGPDVVTGNPNEAFAPADQLPFLSNVIRSVKNTQGLVVYTANSIEIILGGPLTATFYSVTLAPGVGLGNYNALDVFAGEQFFMDTTGQLRVLSPTLSLTSAGHPITNQLIKFNPKTVYVTFNEQPNDSAVYVGTGSGLFPGVTNNSSTQLGLAANYAILAAAGITNSGSTVITGGNIGSFPTTSITGFPPGVLTAPAIVDNAGAAAAQGAALVAYNFYSGLAFTSLSASSANLSVLGNGATASTYLPGNYSAGSSMDIPTSITLDAQGNPNAVFVFKAGSTITLEGGASVILANGALAGNIIWLVGSSFTSIFAGASVMQGNILANTSITLGGGVLNGRALAGIVTTSGAVTIATAEAINVPASSSGIIVTPPVGGAATGWFRMNPRQSPGGPNGPEPVWSTFAAISAGCNMLQSIVVSPGVKKLLVGSTQGGLPILERDLTLFTDDGTAYGANFQIGSLILAHRGELAILKFLEMDFAKPTTAPVISYLLNEINGTFSNFVNGVNNVPEFDPPAIYGNTLSPSSYNPLRYYFSSTGQLARCVHMQVSVDFGVTPNADEIFNTTIFGAVVKNM